MKMASDADEFKEELQRLAHVAKIRNDERIQTNERALQLFGPIRDFLLRFNEALGEFGKIEVAGPYPVGKYQHATGTINAPNGRVVSWEFVLSESGVSYQRIPYQLSEYSRLESQLKSDVVAFLEKICGALTLIRPSGPRSLKRCTQSRSVWRSMPPMRAASSRSF